MKNLILALGALAIYGCGGGSPGTPASALPSQITDTAELAPTPTPSMTPTPSPTPMQKSIFSKWSGTVNAIPQPNPVPLNAFIDLSTCTSFGVACYADSTFFAAQSVVILGDQNSGTVTPVNPNNSEWPTKYQRATDTEMSFTLWDGNPASGGSEWEGNLN